MRVAEISGRSGRTSSRAECNIGEGVDRQGASAGTREGNEELGVRAT
jgi:hypothetical protein